MEAGSGNIGTKMEHSSRWESFFFHTPCSLNISDATSEARSV
jgi:hypothetical protein